MMFRLFRNICFRLFDPRRGLGGWPRNLAVKVVLRPGKFANCLTKATRQFREFLRAEQEKDDEKENQTVGPEQIG